MTTLPHATIIASGFAFVAATVTWLMQEEKSSYVRFQALQTLEYQFVQKLTTFSSFGPAGHALVESPQFP